MGSRDVKLSSKGRSLNEEVSLKHTIKRLSRNIVKEGFEERINEVILKETISEADHHNIISIDFTEIIKPYAKKMEYVEKVYDGSNKSTGIVYNMFVSSFVGPSAVKPMYEKMFSAHASGYRSSKIF